MALWTFVLLALYGALRGEETTLQQCCQDGRTQAKLGQDCAVIAFTASSETCGIAQEHCCTLIAGGQRCTDGIKLARSRGPCERPFFRGAPWETRISKMCCDCCTLGLKLLSQKSSCELHGLFLDDQCAKAAKACCAETTLEEIKPAVRVPTTVQPENATTQPPVTTVLCKESNCSQLCVGNGTCACHSGYQLQKDGVKCEDIDECTLNTHNCGKGFVCLNTAGSFRCDPKCPAGTSEVAGKCVDINECMAHPPPCPPGQICVNSVGSYICRSRNTLPCEQGYRPNADGTQCEDVDECRLAHFCGQHACVNLMGSYRCECKAGFTFNDVSKLCEDVNECLTGRHNCVTGQTCINTEGYFRCQRETSCGTGYELTDDNRCLDIDECILDIHNCGKGFVCSNTAGSFRCYPKEKCAVGFIQDAAGSCIDINECVALHAPCPPGQTCINSLGSYTCRKNTVHCGRGYHLNADGTRCEDVDECRFSNVCGLHGCVNLMGSYRCECQMGFVFNSITKLCEDVNECNHYPGRLCAHKCDNTEGSYLCSCTTGFRLSHDGRNCEDVNECEANPCSQECANVFGSYQCYCRRGFQLSDIDGITCEDIDECALPTGGHVCSYNCSNVPGSFYCTCPLTGYTLAHNGRTCQDIDECAAGSHTCSVNENCINIHGGFRCLTLECPWNYKRAVQGRCERVACEFTPDPAACFSLPLRISFYNMTIPISAPVPADVFRMGPSNSVPGDELLLNIVSGDEEGYFVVQQQAHGGVITLHRALSEPRDFNLTVEMRLIRYGTAYLYMAKIAVFFTHEHPIRSQNDGPVSLRCVKACQLNDLACALDPINIISQTVLSLPTFRDFREPEEIAFLRTNTPAKRGTRGGPDASFEILGVFPSSSEDIPFMVVKTSHQNMIIGVVQLLRPIIGPVDLELQISITYFKSGIVTHRRLVILHIFISKFWF